MLDTLEYLVHGTDVWVELTTLLIPGRNDSDAELDEMTRWVVEHLGPDVPMHFTAFHPDFKMTDIAPTPSATLTRAREIALGNGVRHAYTGNTHDAAGGSTYCAACGERVIERDWYVLGEYRVTDDGHCGSCGAAIPGRFDGPAGHWGARRLPVRLADFAGGSRSRRAPAVAGRFYPADPRRLAADVDDFVRAGAARVGSAATATTTARAGGARPPKALVVPHAGYPFSGPIAGSGYAALAGARGVVERVVLLGPAHFVPVDGIATTGASEWETPLGSITIDDALRRAVLALPSVCVDDSAHAPEHSLEVHLPFLQRTLGAFTLLPLVVGRADPDTVAAVIDAVWGGPETLVVVSSDLSHYLDHDTAAARDRRTAGAIVGGTDDTLDGYDACGISPVRGLLVSARRHGLTPRLLDLRNSGDTAGPRDRVVGYGAFAFEPAAPGPLGLDDSHRAALFDVAAKAVRRVLYDGRTSARPSSRVGRTRCSRHSPRPS